MKKWKYRYDTISINIGDEEVVNKIGQEGWEIFNVVLIDTPYYNAQISENLYLIVSKKQI